MSLPVGLEQVRDQLVHPLPWLGREVPLDVELAERPRRAAASTMRDAALPALPQLGCPGQRAAVEAKFSSTKALLDRVQPARTISRSGPAFQCGRRSGQQVTHGGEERRLHDDDMPASDSLRHLRTVEPGSPELVGQQLRQTREVHRVVGQRAVPGPHPVPMSARDLGLQREDRRPRCSASSIPVSDNIVTTCLRYAVRISA